MLGEILLKMIPVLTPDDIKQMKAAGCGDEVRAILGDLYKLAVSWHDGKYGVMSLSDVQLWADAREKLKELRAALNEG
jgi:hypothetical protein